MKAELEKDFRGYLLRLRTNGWTEVAYARLGVSGLQAEIEFPNDWHEKARAWVRIGLGFMKIAFSFPSKRYGTDDCQCQGPTYGFQFYSDMLWVKWGQPTGRSGGSPSKTFWMPWRWNHREHKILSEKESHPYVYTLKTGEVQRRVATINKESRYWTRYWLPWRMERTTIKIEFDDEVGERSGSWKGGCIGCGYEMRCGETPLQTLRRMEVDRKF